MPQPTVDYATPATPAPRSPHVRNAALASAGVVLVANVVLLAMARSDRSWGALGIGVFVGPIVNAVLLLLSLACIPLVRSAARGAPISAYVATSIAIPLIAIPVDFILILSMGLSGC